MAVCVLALSTLPRQHAPLAPPAQASAALATAAPDPLATDPSTLCIEAARHAAARTGVPEALLLAVTLAETGRRRGDRLRPWPWALNVAGQGYWPESRAAARHHLRRVLPDAPGHVDIGCFQINLHWHGGAFAGPEAMLDPKANALYAAHFLQRLHAETGEWKKAVGLYHSRSPERAATYRARVMALHAALATPPRRDLPRAALPPIATPGTATHTPATARAGSLFAAGHWAGRPAAPGPFLALAPGPRR
ncbi:MAG: hypothetical protein CVT80_08010 [Alphaproteobacteria bacterium HGW-Alphaproteobacteria-2]|nr:MAG: hypothetical protein CVT80_08010 [Alphaproteobacteria bacterium HGW-Alphaproteobacteria-2]